MTIYEKEDRAECGNYRGISLLAIAGKFIAKTVPNRLQIISEDVLYPKGRVDLERGGAVVY